MQSQLGSLVHFPRQGSSMWLSWLAVGTYQVTLKTAQISISIYSRGLNPEVFHRCFQVTIPITYNDFDQLEILKDIGVLKMEVEELVHHYLASI